jgi:hypothetical protein
MIRWRRETILDVYNLGLGIILLAVPWLFAFAHTKASAIRTPRRRPSMSPSDSRLPS